MKELVCLAAARIMEERECALELKKRKYLKVCKVIIHHHE